MNAIGLILIVLSCSMVVAYSENRPTGKSFATRSEVLARHGMACTSQPLATQAALAVLKQGGSAVDAAIAADAVLDVGSLEETVVVTASPSHVQTTLSRELPVEGRYLQDGSG